MRRAPTATSPCASQRQRPARLIALERRLGAYTPACRRYVVNPHIGKTIGLSPLVTLLSVAVVGEFSGGSAVVFAVPFTSAVATLIDVLVIRHDPPAAEPPRSLRLTRSG